MQSINICLYLIFILISHGRCWLNIQDLDWSIRPTDDFFNFVNNRWLNQTNIPKTEVGWGSLFTMQYENKYLLENLLNDLIRNENIDEFHVHPSIKRRLTDFYLAGLDEQSIENVGLEPVRNLLIQLENVRTYEQLLTFTLNVYKRLNIGLILHFEVLPDDKNTTVYMVDWQQTGLRLPERSYYFLNDSKSETIRENYIVYIDRILQYSNSIVNLTTNLTDARDVFELEKELARSHRTVIELRDPNLNYNKFHLNQLDKLMPNLHWHRIHSILNIKNQTILMSQPDYYQFLDRLIVNRSLSLWKNKIRFTLLDNLAKFLNRDLVQAHFYMFDHLINGQKKDKTRSMKIIELIDKYLGELLGQLFVSRYFSAQSKEHTIDLVRNLIDVYQQRIRNLNWLTNSTKEQAIEKLDRINMKIGYPSKWKTYSGIQIDRSSFFNSIASIFRYNYLEKLRKLKRSVDRNEWLVTPQTVNAFNYLSFNEIIFPAAILQRPFYSIEDDDALNYGGIGYIIGHELTHALDDQGRKYDANGNMKLWWTDEDIQRFNARTELLVRQYDQYQILNTKVNGRLTLGENIADLGGLEIAYQAFLRTKQANDGKLLDGFTPKQRFFLAAARVWRMKVTDEKLISSLKEEPHPPAKYRVNGPLSNMFSFYEAFHVKEGDGMYRKENDRVLIW